MTKLACNEVVFMPWADVKTDTKIGPFVMWVWDRSRVQNRSIAAYLDKYFTSHIDHFGKPVSSITIVSRNGLFAPASRNLLSKARTAADVLVFSEIYPGIKAAVCNDTRNMTPPTADRFQLVTQRFTPGDKMFSVQIGGTVHVGQINKLHVTRPWDLGGIGFPDEELLQGLGSLTSRKIDETSRERIRRSLEWFRLAHTSGDDTSALTKVMMMATAFEILLQIPEGPGKTANFIQAIESRVLRPSTKHDTRKVEIRVGKKKGTKKSVNRSLPGWWAEGFYDLRSRIVHGDPVDVRRLKYRRWLTHLIVADLVFGQCLIEDLYAMNAFGAEIRRLSREYDRLCAGRPAGWNEQHLKDQLFGFADVHRKLGWLPRKRT